MPHAPSTDLPPELSPDILRQARRLPKVLLHEHLDGGLRVATLLALLRERGVAAPADDEETLAAWFDARAHAGSLAEYLRGFALTVAAMATPEAMSRVAFEAAEDARADQEGHHHQEGGQAPGPEFQQAGGRQAHAHTEEIERQEHLSQHRQSLPLR